MTQGETSPASGSALEPIPESVLGHQEFGERAAAMIRLARHEIVLFSYDLDRRIYGSDAFVAALRAFVLEHRRARLRGVVNSARLAMRGAHKLVELSRTLSSRIEFRELLPERRPGALQDYLVVDQRALLIRAEPQELEARYYAEAPALAREQQRHFDAFWHESPPAREFTDLRL